MVKDYSDLLKKIDNIELYLDSGFAWFKDKGEGYTINYLVALKE